MKMSPFKKAALGYERGKILKLYEQERLLTMVQKKYRPRGFRKSRSMIN